MTMRVQPLKGPWNTDVTTIVWYWEMEKLKTNAQRRSIIAMCWLQCRNSSSNCRGSKPQKQLLWSLEIGTEFVHCEHAEIQADLMGMPGPTPPLLPLPSPHLSSGFSSGTVYLRLILISPSFCLSLPSVKIPKCELQNLALQFYF